MKLLNNALATYHLAATARMLDLAAEHRVPARDLLEVIGVSTGRSWMSDDLVDVQYDLLLKDVGLLRGELGALPPVELDDGVEAAILHARALLGFGSEKGERAGSTMPRGLRPRRRPCRPNSAPRRETTRATLSP